MYDQEIIRLMMKNFKYDRDLAIGIYDQYPWAAFGEMTFKQLVDDRRGPEIIYFMKMYDEKPDEDHL